MLVNCFAYQDGKRIADRFTPADIGAYINRPECLVWVALKDPAPGEFAELQEQFGLHELAVEDASHGHQRPKIEEYGDSLFTVLHVIEIVNDELVVGEVDIFAGPNYVLSVRNHAERGFARRARALRARARTAQTRRRLRALCIDGCRGRPLFSDHGRARDRVGNS